MESIKALERYLYETTRKATLAFCAKKYTWACNLKHEYINEYIKGLCGEENIKAQQLHSEKNMPRN